MRIIKTAIIGLGNITQGYEDMPSVVRRMEFPTHLSVLKRDKRFLVVAGTDIDENSRAVFQKKMPGVKIYFDYLKMIEKELPDLVVVATPTATHVKICQEVIKNGIKVILCEKPISYSLKEAQVLVRLAKERQVTLIFNYFRSFDSGYNRLAAYIKSKKPGEIRAINVNYSNGIFNNASHLINLLEKLFQPIEHVSSFSDKIRSTDPTINFIVKIGEIEIFFRGLSDADYRVLEVDMLFSKERIKLISDKLEHWKISSSDSFSFLYQVKNSPLKIDINRSFFDVYNNIYQHLINKKNLLCTPEEALHALDVACTAVGFSKIKK